MAQPTLFSSLVRLSLTDPVAAGRVLIALRPPMALRWMLLATTVSTSIVLLYLLPALMGDLGALPSPFGFAATQAGMNVVVAWLAARVGAAFGGNGGFADALWLIGWMQAITTLMLAVQVVAMLLLPGLNMAFAMVSIAVSLWVLVGYLCALHGFASRIAVLMGIVGVFVALSMALSVLLILLGYDPSGALDV